MDRQQSLGYYARTDDVSGILLGAGNDYFHQHRRHQFRQVSTPLPPVDTVTTRDPPDFSDTCRSDIEHIYESPNHDGPPSLQSSLSVTGRQPDDSYYSHHDLRVTAS